MTVMATSTLSGRPFTVDDLEAMPDDGRRHELLDGVLIVSPAPGRRHQRVVLRLGSLLDAACPDSMEVLVAPFGVRPSNSTELQPDVLVARMRDLTDKNLPTAPLLAVEVRSPSTALFDLNTKKAAYERMGVPSYWVIDPDESVLTVFELGEDGRYAQLAEVKGDNTYRVSRPFELAVTPSGLTERPSAPER
jgi:Uma2 family endonuclease